MIPRRSLLLSLVLAAFGGLQAAPPAGTAPLSFETQVKPLLENYCFECHGDGSDKGGLSLDRFKTSADVRGARPQWEAILRNVSSHQMPPDDAEPPTNAERDLISRFVEQELFQLDPAHPDPGRVVLRRLNRAEYNATIRDLVGIDFKPAADFPPDDSGYGFDNIGEVLTLPPVLLEKYVAAAERILDAAIVTDPIRSEVRRIPASLAEIGFNAIGDRGDGWVHLLSLEEDDAAVELALPAGDYIFRVQAYATRTGGALKGQGSEVPLVFTEDPGPTKLALMLNDTFVQDFVIGTDEQNPQVYEVRVGAPAGRQRFRAVVARQRGGSENETFMLNGRPGQQQPGIVYVKWLEIEGPLPAATRRYRADGLPASGQGWSTPAGERVLSGNGEISTEIETTRETEVILRAQAYAQQAGTEPTRMEFRVDGRPLQTFDVLAPAAHQPLPKQRVFSTALLAPRPQVYELRTLLPAGRHRFSAALVNELADPSAENPNLRARNLVVQSLEVVDTSGPVVIPPKPPALARLFDDALRPPPVSPLARAFGRKPPPVDESIAARRIVATFARRAWRRSVDDTEVDRLLGLYTFARQEGDTFEGAVKLALQATLVAPHFLFIGETRGPALPSTGPRPIDEFALASRLSY
ncbi:MAG TPA: DUF1587 domain-containing protein, partial [Lacunisphaera sp.]|nr:DUF1587 domain-containing protein [Lacunisphaera sp.]